MNPEEKEIKEIIAERIASIKNRDLSKAIFFCR